MAYNPFTWFRKNQKTLFAILTIIIMFVFTAQFGAGDVMHHVNFWFSTGRSLGQEVTELSGRTVRTGDIDELATRRRLANRFLRENLQREHQAALDNLLNKRLKLDEGAENNPLFGLREIVQKIQLNRVMLENTQRQFQQAMLKGQVDPQLMQFFNMQMNNTIQRAQEDTINSLSDPNTGLAAIAARDNVRDNPEYLDLIMQVGSILGFEFWTLTAQRDDFILGGNREPESILDFMLWQQQADKLGINLTDEDLVKQINRDAGGMEIFEAGTTNLRKNKRLMEFASRAEQEFGLVTDTMLIDALREEYRVAMAQSLLLGHEPGFRAWRSLVSRVGNPTTGTPDEFLQFVRDYRTTLRVQLMPLNIEAFVSQVTDQPSEEALRRLFDRYKEQEPDPARRSPGFKLPRRIRAQYVLGNAESSHFREAGLKRAEFLDNMSETYRRGKIVLLAPVLSPLGAGPLGMALAISGPIVQDPVQAEYERYLESTQAWIYPEEVSTFDRERQLQLASVIQPGALASTIALPGGPVPMLASLYGNATMNEAKGAIRFNAARILGSAPAQPGWASLLTTVALSAPHQPTVLPRETLQPMILANLGRSLAREQVHLAVSQLREELIEKKDGLDVAARAKELHLEFHEMPKAVSQLALEESTKTPGAEKGLEVFKDALNRIARRDFSFVEIARILFADQGTFVIGQQNQAASDTEELAFWRAEDLGAKLRTFPEAREDVVLAWKREQARDLARRKAVDIRNRINKEKLPPTEAVRLLTEWKTGELFTLDGVARAVPPQEVRPEARTEYRPFELPESAQKHLPYPPEQLPKILMELKRPGDAMVFVDRPATNFYVAVLEARDEPSVSDFRKIYDRTPFRDPLFDMFQAERRAEYRKSVLEQLRREAGAKLDKEGNYDLPDFLRRSTDLDDGGPR